MKEKSARPRGTGSKRLRGKIWWIRYYYKGKRIDESTESGDEREADRKLRLKLGEMEQGKRPLAAARTTISRLVDMVIADYAMRKLRSADTVKLRADAHVKRLLGPARADRCSKPQIEEYISARQAEGASDATINRELAIVRRGFTLALEAEPPLIQRAPHIRKLAEENVREGFLEHDQYLALREALPVRLKCLLVVGYHLGLRLGELRKLRWEQVDLKAGEIKLPGRNTKSKKPRTAPIYGDMKAFLEMQLDDRNTNWPGCPWVFHYRNRQIGHHVKGWTEACAAAGVQDLLRHDMRRSAIRNMERAGIPRTIAMAISGHRTEAVYRRYDIVSAKDLVIAREKLEQFFGPSVPKVGDNSGTISAVKNREVN
jgi:integrase